MTWRLSLLRRFRKRAHRQPPTRPNLEYLEPRLAPANIDVLSSHYDAFLSGVNTQETVLTPAHVNSTEFGLLYSQPRRLNTTYRPAQTRAIRASANG